MQLIIKRAETFYRISLYSTSTYTSATLLRHKWTLGPDGDAWCWLLYVTNCVSFCFVMVSRPVAFKWSMKQFPTYSLWWKKNKFTIFFSSNRLSHFKYPNINLPGASAPPCPLISARMFGAQVTFEWPLWLRAHKVQSVMVPAPPTLCEKTVDCFEEMALRYLWSQYCWTFRWTPDDHRSVCVGPIYKSWAPLINTLHCDYFGLLRNYYMESIVSRGWPLR